MKFSWLAIFMVTVSVAAGGCSGGRDTLKIALNNGVEGVALKYVAAAFANKNNVTVDIVELPYDQLYSLELEDVQRDKSKYDVIMLDDPWFVPLLTGENENKNAKRLLEPLNLNADQEKDATDFVESCIAVCRDPHTERLYALPFVGNTQLFVYRREGAEAAPRTWAKVLERQRALEKSKKVGYVMRVQRGNSIVTDFLPILWSAWQREGAAMDPDENRTRLALEQLQSLGPDLSSGSGAIALHGPNLSLVAADDFDLAIHLVRGEASMSIIWSAWIMAMTKARADTVSSQDQLYVAEVPGGMPAMGAWLLGIPKGSQNIPLARKFLLFATSKDSITQAAERGNPPPRKSVLKDATLNKTFPWFECQLKSLESARPRPQIADWRRVESDLGVVLSDLYAGVLKPEEAMARSHGPLAPFLSTRKTHPGMTCTEEPLLGR